MENEQIEGTLKFFSSAVKSGLLKFTIENDWLTVEFKNNLDFDGEKWNWKHLCSQSLNDYKNNFGYVDDKKLVNRITTMLAEKLRSIQQDVNGINK